MPAKSLQVFIFKNSEFVGSDIYDKTSVKIGRDEDVEITLESTHVSRHHATLEHDGESVRVIDAGSKNGLYVNGDAVKQAVLGPSDKLSIGEFTLKVKLVAAHDAASAKVRHAPEHGDRVVGSTVEGHIPPAKRSAIFDAPPSAETGALSMLLPPLEEEPERNSPRDEDEDATHVGDEYGSLSQKTQISQQFDLDEHTQMNLDGAVQSGTGADTGLRRSDSLVHPAPPGDDDSNVGWHPEPQDGMSTQLGHSEFVHGTEDDEHDEDEPHFVAPYSLAKKLISAPAGNGPVGRACVEMVTVVNDKVVDVTLLKAGRGSWSLRDSEHSAAGLQALRCGGDGECLVVAKGAVRGGVRRGAQVTDLVDFLRPHGNASQGVLKRGDTLSINDGRTFVTLRHVYPPDVLPDMRSLREKMGVDGTMFSVIIASLLAHALVLVAVMILTPAAEPPAKDQEFVVAVKQEPQLQEKTPEPPKPPEPPPPEPEKPQKMKAKRMPRPQKHMKAAPERPAAPVPAPPGILGLLSKKGATQAPGPAAAVAAVSNLNAVKVPGAAGGYRVSGLIGKLPTSSGISVGGGGGALVTKGANALLRGGGGGAGKMADVGQRRVGGLVQKVARGMHMTGGSLDRGSIERVVNEHIDEIQRCYERELLHDSSLAGKVQVEWIIGSDGSVTSTRQMSSTLQSPAGVRCIMDAIKTWKFPRPTGGQVVVDYPFILKGLDF